MDELNEFEKLLLTALDKVDESYYRTTYKNIESFRDALAGRMGRFTENDFEKYGERVFCYEFYHQLRYLIDNFRMSYPDFLNGTILQAEVKKIQVIELIEKLGLEKLNGEYAPDFLMHSPGEAKSHPFVIEVKCNNAITKNHVLNDLLKLNEFVNRYHYQKGVFISINTSPSQIKEILGELEEEIQKLEGRQNISIICKPNQSSPHSKWQL